MCCFPWEFYWSFSLIWKNAIWYCWSQIGTCHGCLPSTSTRVTSRAVAGTAPPTPMKEFRMESRNEAFCGKTGRTGLQIVRYSQELFLWAQFLYLIIARKALKSFMVTTVSQQKLSAKKKSAWLHVLPLYQNHMYTILPPYLSGAVSQSYLRLYLPGCSPHFAPNKT